MTAASAAAVGERKPAPTTVSNLRTSALYVNRVAGCAAASLAIDAMSCDARSGRKQRTESTSDKLAADEDSALERAMGHKKKVRLVAAPCAPPPPPPRHHVVVSDASRSGAPLQVAAAPATAAAAAATRVEPLG